MKVIIAGGRDFDNELWLENIMFCLYGDSDYGYEYAHDVTFIGGGAKGADELGEKWACENVLKYEKYPADWNKHGKAAGHIRNTQMAKDADVLVAFWDGKSKGTHHMIGTALDHGLEVHVYRY